MRGIARATVILLFCLGAMIDPLPAFSQTIWTIQNPQPPWDEYEDVHFVNNQLGFAVGEGSRVIRTDDGGVSWSLISSNLTSWLYRIQFVNADTGWVAGYGIFKTTDGGTSWQDQSGVSEIGFMSMYFVNDQIGYAGTPGGEIYKTINGGDDWELINEEYGWVRVLYFIDENLGWAMSRHKMRFTEDGGVSWTESLDLPYFEYGDLVDFQFVHSDTGLIITDEQYMFSTMDAGSTWDTITGPVYNGLTSLHFFNSLHGLLFSEYGCYITLDGGESYELAGGDYLSVFAVHFPDEIFGCTVGDRQQYTLDGGNSWTRSDVGHTHDQLAVWMGPDERILTGGQDGKIMLSENNGIIWEEVSSPTANTINDFFEIPGLKLWACADFGQLLFSEDEGITWELSETNFSNSLEAISFGDEMNGICVGKQAAICTTQDGGNTWELNTSPVYLDLNGVCHVDEQTAWICGDDGYLLKTEDAGLTWTEYFLDTNDDLYSICFVSGNRGWTTSRGKIYSSFDGGENWFLEFDYVPGVWSDKIFSIKFKDSVNGWAVGEEGLTLHTEDAGTNWVVHDPVVDEDLFDVGFRSLDDVGVAGAAGNVLYTDQGSYQAPHVISLPPDTIVCSEEEVILLCEATGDSLFYQWFTGGVELPGENNPALIFDSISEFDGGLYSCRLSNGAGTLHSDEFMLSVKPQARVSAHPVPQTVYETDTMIFNQAVVGGLPIFYQWQKDGEDISGANQHVFAIYGVQLSDSGNYRCIVSNSCATDTTDGAWLTVLPASSVNEQSSKSQLHCYPNPTSNNLFVNFIGPVSQSELRVFSLQGVEQGVKMSRHMNGWKLSLENLDPGVYFIMVKTASWQFFSRIIKMNQE